MPGWQAGAPSCCPRVYGPLDPITARQIEDFLRVSGPEIKTSGASFCRGRFRQRSSVNVNAYQPLGAHGHGKHERGKAPPGQGRQRERHRCPIRRSFRALRRTTSEPAVPPARRRYTTANPAAAPASLFFGPGYTAHAAVAAATRRPAVGALRCSLSCIRAAIVAQAAAGNMVYDHAVFPLNLLMPGRIDDLPARLCPGNFIWYPSGPLPMVLAVTWPGYRCRKSWRFCF